MYLGEELVGLAFFDSEISVVHKKLIFKALTKPQKNSRKKATVAQSEMLANKISLDYFVTEKTKCFFDKLGLSSNFLNIHPLHWENDNEYQQNVECISKLKVVNDCAERGVALVQEYNTSLSKNESEKQNVLQVVPTSSSKSLSELQQKHIDE